MTEKNTDSTETFPTLTTEALEATTGGYRTDGVDSVEYQTWYFTEGPGAAKK